MYNKIPAPPHAPSDISPVPPAAQPVPSFENVPVPAFPPVRITYVNGKYCWLIGGRIWDGTGWMGAAEQTMPLVPQSDGEPVSSVPPVPPPDLDSLPPVPPPDLDSLPPVPPPDLDSLPPVPPPDLNTLPPVPPAPPSDLDSLPPVPPDKEPAPPQAAPPA